MTFELDAGFVEGYRSRAPPFGFNGLGRLVYMRTYSRLRADGANEDWFETVRRVVEGTYRLQQRHIESHGLGWDAAHAQRSAQEMYERMFAMKFLPPGRGLWAMGTPIVDKGLAAALNNCAFVSTAGLGVTQPFHKPFKFLQDMCMLGVGVGFDCAGANNFVVAEPLKIAAHVVEDTREGWVGSTVALLDAFDPSIRTPLPQFDYSRVRPSGKPLKTFGGISSGPQPLINMHVAILEVLWRNTGSALTSTTIVDLMNLIGKCVVSGNVRRTAEIAFGEPTPEFLDLKDYAKNPQRASYGWTSNNSVYAELGMDYGDVCERIGLNGEPGLCWLGNMQRYSRMGDAPDDKDARVRGGNPCLEQSLESYELCCLVETFPDKHESTADFLRTLKFAFLYAKTVTLCSTHWAETNRVMMRNRRIGCSLSGIAQYLNSHSIHALRDLCERGYAEIQRLDTVYSEWMCIPHSIKTTSIKPSGTVSLLAGSTPGCHYPESRFYIRRVRMSATSVLVKPLRAAGYVVEPAVGAEADTVVVEIPVDAGAGIRTVQQVSMWEQLALAAFLQRYWADNQVSCTVTFDPVTEGAHLRAALDFYQYQLKGISFLPRLEYGAYPQMPYEAIDAAAYAATLSKLRPLNFFSGRDAHEGVGEEFCDGDACARQG
jgi:ribonucleoside-triphosphate reductase (thioredoxin)